jgi:hypothetical protein
MDRFIRTMVLAPALFDSGVLGFVGSEVAEMESMW